MKGQRELEGRKTPFVVQNNSKDEQCCRLII